MFPYPKLLATLVAETKELNNHEPWTSVAVVILSSISLSVGASVGPEAALGLMGSALGTVVGKFFTDIWMPVSE